MNTLDIFRKLTKGLNLKFDKRFDNDRKKLGQLKPSRELDGPIAKNADSPTGKIVQLHETNEGDTIINENGKRPATSDETTERKKKKKRSAEKLAQLRKDEINLIRKQNNIHTWGTDISAPVTTFEELKTGHNVSETIVTNLRSQGYEAPTPIQMQAWPLLLSGRELLACAPTGSGKTAGFLIPVIHSLKGPRKKGFRAVVVSPTRELARQTFRECQRLTENTGLKTHFITNVSKARLRFGPNAPQKFDILITTPNRLAFLCEGENAVSLSNVQYLIIDESDRLFEAGIRGFRDQIAKIYQACSSPNVVRAMFSATFALEVERWAKLNLNNVCIVTIGMRNTACSDVHQELLFCGNESGKLLALRDILRKGYEPPMLIFVQTKERAKQLFRELLFDNIMVEAIHADRTELQRDNIVKAFRDKKIWVLICTELMGRGIDFKGVSMVVNYDFPPSVISYVHRVGRTGRAGYKGRAITLWTMDDRPLLKSVARVMKDSGSEVPDWMLQGKKTSSKERKMYAKKMPDRGIISDSIKHEDLIKSHLQKAQTMREKSRMKGLKKSRKLDVNSNKNPTTGKGKLKNTGKSMKPSIRASKIGFEGKSVHGGKKQKKRSNGLPELKVKEPGKRKSKKSEKDLKTD